MLSTRKIARLTPELAVFFECDVQAKMATLIKGFDSVAVNSARLAQSSQTLNIPVISTVQVNFGAVHDTVLS
jgi:hypothetical protein